MKVYAINGSPRKNNNTATLLKTALEGVIESVKDTEVETEIINLMITRNIKLTPSLKKKKLRIEKCNFLYILQHTFIVYTQMHGRTKPKGE